MNIIDLTSSPPAPIRPPKHATKPTESTKPPLPDPVSPIVLQDDSAFDGHGQYSPTTDWMQDDIHDIIHEPKPWDDLFSDSYYKRCEMSTMIEKYGVDEPFWDSYVSKSNSKATQPSTSGSKGTAAAEPPSVKEKSKTATHFYVLSDDEHTIDPKPVPAAKRRRVSSPYASSEIVNGVFGNVTDSLGAPYVGTASATDVATSGKPAATKVTKKRILEDDPTAFTLSPDVTRVARDKKGKQKYDHTGDSMSENWENHGHSGKGPINPSHKRRLPLEDISLDLEMPDLGNIASQRSSSGTHTWSQGNAKDALEAYNAEEAAPNKASKKPRKKQDNSCSVDEKLGIKEAEKARKQQEKERKAEEKQRAIDLAKVNTLRTDKKISTPEMMIDLPADLESGLAEQVRQFLGPLDVECRKWNSPIRNVIKWRRKVEAIYNEEMEHWEPAPLRIKSEKHVMCVICASEFVDLTVNEEGEDLDAHVLSMKTKFEGCTVIYLIEGLTAWMRKNKNVKNRAFTQAVRDQMAEDGIEVRSTSYRAKKKKKTQQYIDEDMIEDALLRLQVIHGMLIHHTTTTIETAEWMAVFTQHISTIPYRQASLAVNASFCMASGQVSTGINTSDTFLKMLQEINRITAPISCGVANEYDSATKLVEGFEAYGKDMLTDVKKSANKDGAVSDKTVGKSISRRLNGIFMGRDEGSYDV